MKAVLVLAASLFSLSFATSVAQGNYFIQAGDEFTAGQQITSVPGVTLVMPTYAQNDDTETPTQAAAGSANYADADFVAQTPGNGGNPKLTEGVWHGTTYTFKVAKDGYITAGVVLNANKTLALLKNDTENVLATAKYNLPSEAGGESQELDANSRVAAKAYGVVSFPVEAGNTYNIHCNGSKMGFYGFKFSETDPMAQEEASDFLPASELNFEGASVLSFSNMGLYGAAGTKANKIIGVEDTEAEDFAIQAANSSLLLETAPNIQVNGASVKAITVPAGEQVVISVPANKLATKLSIIAFANVYDSTATYRPTYFKEINGKEYTAETIDTLTSYRNFEHPDTFIVVCEELEQLTLTAEGEAVAFVAVVETIDNPYTVVEIDGNELLRNGDFETWKDNVAEWWASVKTTASNGAALTKTDDAYEGDAAIQIGNTTANKRLAYRELKLKKGTYYFSFMAKAVKGAKKMPSIQYGFVPSVDGKVGSYVYQDTKTIPSANKWTQYIDTLKFENDTVINLLVMSKKSTADVLVDAASLKTNDGALIDYFESFEYADQAAFYIYEGMNDTIDYSVAPFGGVVVPVTTSNASVASAAANATAIIVSALAPGKAAISATLDGVTKTINYTVLEIGTGIETEQTVQGVKGAELVGKSYTVDAAYVLGEIENGYETFATDGNADNSLTVKVKEGARIKSIKIEAGANDEGLAESAEPISITAISIDGGDNILMPAESGAKPLTVVTKVIGIPAYPEMATILEAEDVLDNITFWFDNTNVKANKAVTMKYTIVYEIPEIELTLSADTIQVDETATISAKVTPASYVESRGYSVVYKLADGTAATIDGNVITGVDAGVASVVAYLINGTDTAATATAEVAVVAKPLPPTPPTPEEPEVEVAWKNLGVVDFEDATSYLDGWTFTGKHAEAQVETADGKHYLSNYASGGAGYMTYTVSNANYLKAESWKVVFEWQQYSSNSKNSTLVVKGVNNETIFYTANGSWAATADVFAADGTNLGTINAIAQNKNTRGKIDCVAPAHVVTLVGQADGIYLTIAALDGTEEIAKVKVQEYDHVSAIYQELGNQLAAAAFNDIAFYEAGKTVSTEVAVVDFEDAASYLDGWTFTGKHAEAQVETADGKHYLSNYASGGAGYMTYTVSNAKFLAADGWNLDFEWQQYSSNSKNSALVVKGVENATIFYTANGAWAGTTEVFAADGTKLGEIAATAQDKGTRGKIDCVAPAHHISLRGQADGIYLTITALDGTEEIAKVKVQEFDHVSAIYQELGNQLAAAAFNDMIFAIDDVATWGDAVVLDFEDATSYLDGWTFTGKHAEAQVETEDGKHYLSNYASGGAGYMTYTVSNTKVLSADEWNLKFEWQQYSSNSKNSALVVKGVDNETIFYTANGSWAATADVFAADGTNLGTINAIAQDKSTRGKSDCVAPAHVINLHGQADGIYLTITALDGTEEIAKVKVQNFDHVSAIYQELGNQLAAAAFNDMIFSVLAAGETLDKPKFTITGNAASSNLVAISTPNEGATIYYSVDGADPSVYTEAIRVYQNTEIAAYTTKTTDGGEEIKSDVATVNIQAGNVPAPKYEVIAVDGLERTVKLSDDSARTNIFYGIGSAPATAYSEPFKTSAADSIYVVATLKDLYTETVFSSDTVNAGVLAGSWIKLDTVMFKRVHFDAKTNATAADTAMEADYVAKELSAWQVYLDPDQTLCNPEKKISLIYVTSDHKDTTDLGTYNTGDTVYHIPYGGVFATAHADGYADSYGHVFFRPAPKLDTVMWIDFDTIAIRKIEDKGSVTLSANDHFTANGVEMAPITMVDSVVDVRFGVQTGSSWLSRSTTGGGGLYNFNGGNRTIGISGVQAHQLVVFEYTGAAINFVSDNLEENASLSNGDCRVYTCTEAGNVAFNLVRYGYIKRVGVLNSSDVVMNPVFSIDRVDGIEHFVKIESTGSEDCANYYYYYSYVTSDSLNENYELANQYYDTLGFTTSVATEIVDYNTGEHTPLTYDTTWVTNLVKEYWTPYYRYEEPIGITDTTVFRAYAWYQDLKSDVVIDTIAAGTPVQLARPVITYVGSTDTTDLYQITVDNSEVISQPKCSVYVGWSVPNQEIANGDTIAVDKDIYGWFYAQAFADGYNWSESAYRYVDARESHNETYTALYNTWPASDTIMPASTADFEISPMARFTSTTLRASGNVYYHKWMEVGFNSIALPFVPAYVTDAKGNKLTDGEDYKIYNFTSKGNGNATSDASLETSVIGIDLENYRRTAKLNAYTGAYLYYTEQAGEVIFVSSNGVQFRANNTMTMAARNEGWQVAINNTFKDQESTAAFYEVVANPAGMAGSALVRRDSGTVIAPFTAVLLVDTAFMNATDTIPLEYAHKGAAIEIHSATLANGSVEVKFSAMPVTYNVVTDEYEVVEGLKLTYNVEMFIVTEEGVESLGTVTAKNVEGANYTATIKGGEAGQTVMIVVTTSIQGSDVLVTVLGEGDSTNGIETLTADDKFADGPIYNINGMRVEKVQKGQNYIMNGKKFQVR